MADNQQEKNATSCPIDPRDVPTIVAENRAAVLAQRDAALARIGAKP
jgi:hypothetical protein